MSSKVEYKIIADHLRSSCFLIADGVLPSNEGRGYVLRRIMRRAMRQIHMLGAKEAKMHKFVAVLVSEMKAAYPELEKAKNLIIETLKIEEEKFRETLDKGLKILEEEISKNSKELSGEIAFKLYDTYGFPLDLTQDILKEKNIKVDEKGFDEEMQKQRQRAKKNWVGSGEEKDDKIFFKLKEKFGATNFTGYEKSSENSKILAIENFGDETIIILDKTPFYATSGGQKGDNGIIKSANGEAEIYETKKMAGNLFVHFSKKISGQLNLGENVEAKIDCEKRRKRSNNHSATHLMHKALKEVLGSLVAQKGSNVDHNGFTFDFNLNQAMRESEIIEVENLVNFYIQKNNQVETKLMSLEESKKQGVEALFGEKYDDNVRVVAINPSIELCGGTHANASGDIGVFKIISEKGIASGIRRIEAITGNDVLKYLRNKEKEILEDKKKFFEDLKTKDKEIQNLKQKIIFANLANVNSENISGINLIAQNFDDIDAKQVREVINNLLNKYKENYILAIFGSKDNKVSLSIALTSDLLNKFDAGNLIKEITPIIGGKGGGGQKDMAFAGGNNKKEIPQAIKKLRELIS